MFRYELYRKMNNAILQDVPIIPLYYDMVLRFASRNISGLGINPINMLDLRRVRKRN